MGVGGLGIRTTTWAYLCERVYTPVYVCARVCTCAYDMCAFVCALCGRGCAWVGGRVDVVVCVMVGEGACGCGWVCVHVGIVAHRCVRTHVCTHVQMCTHVCTCVLMCVCGVNHGAGADVRGWVGAVRLTVGGCVFGCWWLWLAGLSWVRVNGAGKMRPPRYVCVCT